MNAVDEFAAWMDRKRQWQGVDEAYTARWDEALWRAAWVAIGALRHHGPTHGGPMPGGFYTIRPTDPPVFPDWLRREINGHVWPDIDSTWPVLCSVPSHLGDWFAWQEEHPDDLTVAIDEGLALPSTFTVDVVRQAWQRARDNGSYPLLWITLEPTLTPGSVRAILNGLYVVTRTENPVDITADINRIIGFTGETAPECVFDLDEVRDKALWFNAPEGSTSGASVVFWDWTSWHPEREWTGPGTLDADTTTENVA